MEVRRIHCKKPVELQGHQLAVAKQSNYPLVYRRKPPKSPKFPYGTKDQRGRASIYETSGLDVCIITYFNDPDPF
jgi:hypothetical protein